MNEKATKTSGKNNAKLYDPLFWEALGINPKNGLPIKLGGSKVTLPDDVRKLIRIKDEQEFCNRIIWYNTGLTINSMQLERLLYYKYRLAFFFFNGGFWAMPFTLASKGDLDFYAMENYIKPLPLNDNASEEARKVLSDLTFKVVKEPLLTASPQDLTQSAVIIRDYTPQWDIQNAIPRQVLQDGLISFESDIIPYLRTSLINSCGVIGVKVNDPQETADVIEGANAMDSAAKKGTPWIPLNQKLDRQPLTGTGARTAQDYLMAYQSIDNMRQSFLGVNKSGIYDKSQYVNEAGVKLNQPIGFPLTDCLRNRQDACNIINSIWDLNITAEMSETALGMDYNNDGIANDSDNPLQSEKEDNNND